MATKQAAVSVTTTATRLDTFADDWVDGQSFTVYNNGAVTVWLGGADVTTANGTPLAPGAYAEEKLVGAIPSANVTASLMYGIVASGTCECRVMQVGV